MNVNWRKLMHRLNIRRIWYQSLTGPGRIMCCSMIFSSSALLCASPHVQLLLTITSVCTVAGIAGLILRPKLTVSLRPPQFAACDQIVELPVRLSNESTRPAYDLSIELTTFPDGWDPVPQYRVTDDLPTQHATTARVTLRPTRRGLLRWPNIRVVTSFPFNLFRFSRSLKVPGGLLVLPRFKPLARFSTPESAQHFGGRMHESMVAGDAREYVGSREYQPGMSVRRWDYASWARLSTPIVREFADQNRPSVAIVVDMCSTFSHPSEQAREGSLSIAASIGDALFQEKYSLAWFGIGVDFALTENDQPHLQRAALMEALALAQQCKEDGLQRLADDLVAKACRADVVYLVTPTWNEGRSAFQCLLEECGCLVRVVYVLDRQNKETKHEPPADVSATVVSVKQIEAGGIELA